MYHITFLVYDGPNLIEITRSSRESTALLAISEVAEALIEEGYDVFYAKEVRLDPTGDV